MFTFPSHPGSFVSIAGSGHSATGRSFGKLPQFIVDWIASLSQDNKSINIDDAAEGAAQGAFGGASDASDPEISSPTDYGFSEYLEGLLSSVGAENEINRKFNSAEAALQRDWQSSENEINRTWQTEMSNSAYQRAAADLKAAGLNPILAATNGSTSTPAGVVGAGSSASYNVGGGDTFSSILNSVSGIASAISDFLPSSKVVQVFKALGRAK